VLNRRDFLKHVSQFALAASVGAIFPGVILTKGNAASPGSFLANSVTPALPAGHTLVTSAPNRLLRGLFDGRILESIDRGKTWRTVANFGRDCKIADIVERKGQFYVRVVFQGYSFFLKSRDGKVWWTANRIPTA
jgi:hypothetical protein